MSAVLSMVIGIIESVLMWYGIMSTYVDLRLRFTTSWTCIVARTYSSCGDRAFAAAGPGLWNSLPSQL